MESYSVEAILSLVDKGFSSGIDKAQSGIERLGKMTGKIGKQAVEIGEKMTKFVTTPIVGGVTAAIKSYADLEQAYGGVETMFKNSAGTVIKNAKRAYETAGVSATSYMEQVTSFSASLLQGLGGDTAKAAKIADMAVRDMSDNANKFGTNLGDIQNAYQGFAKANFTMLDNLKLGYGGTASEMARLINESGVLNGEFEATAENVKDIPFDKMIEAINKVQQELGVTGTTAEEAAKTVSGSFNMMKASALNLLAGLGDPEADVAELFNQIVKSIQIFGQNVHRVVKQIWDNLPIPDWQKQAIVIAAAAGPMALAFGKWAQAFGVVTKASSKMTGAVSKKVDALGKAVGGALSKAQGIPGKLAAPFTQAKFLVKDASETMMLHLMYLPGKFGTAFTNMAQYAGKFGQGVTSAFSVAQGAMAKFTPVLSTMGNATNQAFNIGAQGATKVTGAIAKLAMAGLNLVGPIALIGAGLAAAGVAMVMFGDQITQALNGAIAKGPEMITGFVNGIIVHLPRLIEQGAQMVVLLADAIAVNLPVIIQKGVDLIQTLVAGVAQALPQLIPAAINVITSFVNAVVSALPQLILIGMQFILSLVQGLVANIPQILAAAQSIFTNFITTANTYLPQIIETGVQIIVNLIEGIANNLPQFLEMAVQAVSQFSQMILDNLPAILEGGVRIVRSLIRGIVRNLPTIAKAGVQIIKIILTGIAKGLPQLAIAGVKMVVELIRGLWESKGELLNAGIELVTGVVDAMKNAVTNFASGIWDGVTGAFDSAKNALFGSSEEVPPKVTTDFEAAADGASNAMARMGQDADVHMSAVADTVATKSRAAVDAAIFEMQGFDVADEPIFDFVTSATGLMDQFSLDAGTLAAQTTENVRANTEPVGTFADFYAALPEGAKAYLGTYADVVGTQTVWAVDNAKANTSEILTMMEWYDMLEPWVQESLAQYGVTVDSLTQQAANSAVENSQSVADAVLPYDEFAARAIEEMESLSNAAPTTAGQTASDVVAQSREIENAKTHYENLRELSIDALQLMANQINFVYRKLVTDTAHHSRDLRERNMDYYNKLSTDAQETFSKMAQQINQVMSKMTQQMTQSVTQMSNQVRNNMSQMAQQVGQIMTQMVNHLRSTMSQAVSAMQSASAQAASAGRNMGAGFYNGLASMSGSIINLAYSIASQAAAVMRSALRIHSPSRVTRAIGEYTGEGMVIGMERTVGDVREVAQTMAYAAVPSIEDLSQANHVPTYAQTLSVTASAGESRTPMQLVLELGSRAYKGFVEDITTAQNNKIALDSRY